MMADTNRKNWKLLPTFNGLLALGGIALTALFIGAPLQEIDRTLALVFLWAAGPYVFLGMGCRILRNSGKRRQINLILPAVLFVVYTAMQFYFLKFAEGAQGEFVFLLLPVFFWIYSILAVFLLLAIKLHSVIKRRAAGISE